MVSKIFSIRFLICVTAMCLTSLTATVPQAHAIAMSSCGGKPFAFQTAEVNVVILPYFQSGSSPRELNGLGSQLALLIKLETLYRAMSYDKWGIVLLTGPKNECDPEKIANELLVSNQIHPGGRLIIVWGKLYQQDQDVYVQTFAKTYRSPLPDEKVAPAEFTMQFAGKTFEGNVTREQFAFPPEQLPISVMNSIAANFEKAIFHYDAPQLSSNKTQLPLYAFRKCDNCPDALAFSVEGREGDWIHVKSQRGKDSKDGYLVAHLEEGMSLNQQMPEVSFIQGLMGFLRYVPQDPKIGQSQSTLGMRVAEQALTDYVGRDQVAQEPETKAAALQLSGILEFEQNRKDSSEQFDAAYALVPYSSDSRNLAAVFRLYREYNLPAKNLRPRDVADDFLAAVALDPKNATVLANLQSFFELLALPAIVSKVNSDLAIMPDEIQSSLDRVKSIRKNLASKATPQN
jgi:hypothetical protein